jgi:hypothetical protein
MSPNLTHESREPSEGAGDAALGVDLDEHVLGRVHVDLELPRLVQRAVQQRQQLLQEYARQWGLVGYSA